MWEDSFRGSLLRILWIFNIVVILWITMDMDRCSFIFINITFLKMSGKLHNFFHQKPSLQVIGKEMKFIFSLLSNIWDHHHELYIKIRIWESDKYQKQPPKLFCKFKISQGANFLKRDPIQVLSREICEIFK